MFEDPVACGPSAGSTIVPPRPHYSGKSTGLASI